MVEAKADYKSASDGLQQAKNYAQTLGLRFAYATNGKSIVGFDFSTGIELEVSDFPDAGRAVEPTSRHGRAER